MKFKFIKSVNFELFQHISQFIFVITVMSVNNFNTLGISFSGDTIYFSELSYREGLLRLEKAGHTKAGFDFSNDFSQFKSSQKEILNISSEIKNFLNSNNITTDNVSVSIGAEQAFIIILPLKYNEGRKSLNSRIYWELSNYFPETYTDYVINTFRMNNVLPSKDYDDFLIIAMHRHTIEFVKRIFKMADINLGFLDIDHFSAENSLRKNYENKLIGKKILLIGLKKRRIDYGYIDNGKYKYFAYSVSKSDNEYNLSLMRKIKSLLHTDPVSGGVDGIFLYGNEINQDTLNAVKDLAVAEVEIINPFECINASELLLADREFRKSSYRFCVSSGVALRKIFT